MSDHHEVLQCGCRVEDVLTEDPDGMSSPCVAALQAKVKALKGV